MLMAATKMHGSAGSEFDQNEFLNRINKSQELSHLLSQQARHLQALQEFSDMVQTSKHSASRKHPMMSMHDVRASLDTPQSSDATRIPNATQDFHSSVQAQHDGLESSDMNRMVKCDKEAADKQTFMSQMVEYDPQLAENFQNSLLRPPTVDPSYTERLHQFIFSQETPEVIKVRQAMKEKGQGPDTPGLVQKLHNYFNADAIALNQQSAHQIIDTMLAETNEALHKASDAKDLRNMELIGQKVTTIKKLQDAHNVSDQNADKAIEAMHIVANTKHYNNKNNILLIKMIENYIHNFGQCYYEKGTLGYNNVLKIRDNNDKILLLPNNSELSKVIQKVIDFAGERQINNINITDTDNKHYMISPEEILSALEDNVSGYRQLYNYMRPTHFEKEVDPTRSTDMNQVAIDPAHIEEATMPTAAEVMYQMLDDANEEFQHAFKKPNAYNKGLATEKQNEINKLIKAHVEAQNPSEAMEAIHILVNKKSYNKHDNYLLATMIGEYIHNFGQCSYEKGITRRHNVLKITNKDNKNLPLPGQLNFAVAVQKVIDFAGDRYSIHIHITDIDGNHYKLSPQDILPALEVTRYNAKSYLKDVASAMEEVSPQNKK